MTPTAEQILNSIENLPITDIETISARVNEILRGHKQNGGENVSRDEMERREAEFAEYLLAKGVISRVPPRGESDDDDDFEPIEFEGEPLSEQIIRERR